MGKPKKGKKDQDEDFGDEEVAFDPTANTQSEEMDAELANKASKKGKKGKKGRKDDDLDDVEREIAEMALEANGGKAEAAESQPAAKKKEKKKKKKDADSDDDEDESTQGKALSRFQMLTVSDDDAGGKDSDEEEDKAANGGIVLESVGNQESQSKSKKEKKKGKKEKAKTAEEEDVDAILAALDEPKEKKKGKKKKKGGAEEEIAEGETKEEEPAPEVEKQAPKVVTIDDYESDEDTKKKKKKKNKKDKEEKEKEEEKDPDAEGEGEGEAEGGEGEEGGTVKTAAQKKKEKKERERQKKLQKQQQQSKKEEGAKGEGEQAEGSREATPAEGEHGEEGETAAEGEGKKKKKKKGEKEEKEKKPKNAALLARIKEQQAKLREEEEARRREEEEAERREEERIRKLEEQKRLEEERRMKKKLKEKERKERLKKEGKLLTDKQKQDRMRLNQMLDNIKEQGGIVPNKDEGPKKRPFYGKKKPKDQQKGGETEKSPSPEDEQAPKLPSEEKEGAEQETEEKVEEEKADEVEDVKDEWDLETDEEEDEKGEETEAKDTKTDGKAKVKTQASTESKEESSEGESDDEEESSEEESSESESEDDRTPAERGEEKVRKRRQEAEARRTTDELRAPVVCVLGHVDTGKTKILDKLRRTNVQDGEAGGITQQIGATNVPRDAIIEKTKMCKEFAKQELKLPGLLIIDTPGHESFSNLRSRGSSLCDIAILVIDIMHGLEPQTIESINLLKSRKTPFVVALNKIDRLYGWKSYPQNDVVNTIKAQSQHTRSEFEERATKAITQLAEEGLNAKLFYENPNPKEYVSLVPTSAHSGDGMGNLVAKICELTQTLLAKRIAYIDELEATVMEVKALHGMGTTIDVILVNGRIQEGQTIVLAGTEGPIITTIRGLLMPQPMKELRVKTNAYIHQKEVKAAQGVKIIAKDLEKSLAGLPLYVAHDKDEIEYFKREAERGLEDALKSIKLSDRGVFVQASTLGSLEALLEYLRSTKVKYAGINIGPVHKKDVMKASIMLEHDPQYAVILAFDVEVKRDVQELADSVGVTIFTADIIYHLFDRFTEYRDNLLKKKQEEFKHVAVFPCKLKIMPQHVFNSRDPIVMGVEVVAGFLKEGTPLCVPTKGFVDIGRVGSIEYNHKPVEIARQGQEVCIKILPTPGEAPKMFGRHFEADDLLVSKISRESIDAVKDYFRKDMTKSDWILIMELKKLFEIL